MKTIKKSCLSNLIATCFEKKLTARTMYVKRFAAQKSSRALNSSSSHLWFIKNSSKIKMVSLSITDCAWSRAHFVEVYKSASKFISDAKGLLLEKNFGKVFLNSPTNYNIIPPFLL